jgi:hypothetical protein
MLKISIHNLIILLIVIATVRPQLLARPSKITTLKRTLLADRPDFATTPTLKNKVWEYLTEHTEYFDIDAKKQMYHRTKL